MERPVPARGWTPPGVMTADAVQILLKSSGLAPSEGLVIAGCGPLLYLLAAQVTKAEAPPAGFLDTSARDDVWTAARHLPGAMRPAALATSARGSH